MPMTEACISFNYFQRPQSLSFAIRKTFPAMRENSGICIDSGAPRAKQPRDCMQPIHVAGSRSLLRTRYGRRGIAMAPTAYATAADDVSRSARL